MIDGTVGDCRRMTSDSELVVLLSLELRLRDEPLTVSQWKHASHVGLVDVIATPWTQLLGAPEQWHNGAVGSGMDLVHYDIRSCNAIQSCSECRTGNGLPQNPKT